LATLLQPAAQPLAATGFFKEVAGATQGDVTGFRYDARGSSHHFFLSQGTPWQIGPWSSDAGFVYCRVSETDDRYQVILCDGTFVAAGGDVLLRFAVPVARCEIEASSDGTGVVYSGESMPDLYLPGSLASVCRNT
jgi:hypothetical protein